MHGNHNFKISENTILQAEIYLKEVKLKNEIKHADTRLKMWSIWIDKKLESIPPKPWAQGDFEMMTPVYGFLKNKKQCDLLSCWMVTSGK